MFEILQDYTVKTTHNGITGIVDMSLVKDVTYPCIVLNFDRVEGLTHSRLESLQKITSRKTVGVKDYYVEGIDISVVVTVPSQNKTRVLGTVSPYQIDNLATLLENVNYQVFLTEDEELKPENIYALGVI